AEPPSLAQEFPMAGLRTPTMSTVLPQTLTGAYTGACTELPESTPGDPDAAPWAPESAWAAPPAAAIMPVAAAMVIRPLRVACRIAVFLPSTSCREFRSRRIPVVWTFRETGRPRSAWRALRGRRFQP